MSKRTDGVHPALKHGGYSGIALLPGEDPAAFQQLHSDLIAEFAPDGRLEEDIVESIARLVWRKQNLSTYRFAHEARKQFLPGWSDPTVGTILVPDAEGRARLGNSWELVQIGEVATVAYLEQELSVVNRLDGMIDRCLKRLLFVRGSKSISSSSSSSAPALHRKRLSAAE